jgi:hypothetical protein
MRLAAYCWAALCVALPAFLVATSGHDPVKAVEYGTMDSGMPPVRFQGNNAAVTVFTDRAGIEEYCGKAQPGYVIVACRREHENGTSFIFMPNPCVIGDKEIYSRVMCHELGHANGWTGEHEK